MSTEHRFVSCVFKASIASCVIACGAVQAAEHVVAQSDVGEHATGAATAKAAVAPRVPLDLRIPGLRQVMAHSVRLGEIDSGAEEEVQAVEIAAEPVLMPMMSEQPAPLGIVAAFAWSGDHPTQAWRILLPLPAESIS